MSTAPTARVWRINFDWPAQLKAAIVAIAFCAVFYNVIYVDLVYKWWNFAADWGHGWIIPAFSIYLIHLNWDRIRRSPVKHCWVGAVVLIAALVLYQFTLWLIPFGYLRPLAMLLALLGVIIWLCGLPVVQYIWLPWLYLLFAVPLPPSIYFSLTDPLARLAGFVAVQILTLLNLEITLVGSTLRYVHNGISGQLYVADACAGMRATVTLCALGVAITFISERPWWQRLIMIASCAPIAVISNLVRVLITCLLHIYVDPKYAQGTWHTTLGLLTLLLAFGMFNGLGWLLNQLFVPDVDDEKPLPSGRVQAAGR